MIYKWKWNSNYDTSRVKSATRSNNRECLGEGGGGIRVADIVTDVTVLSSFGNFAFRSLTAGFPRLFRR